MVHRQLQQYAAYRRLLQCPSAIRREVLAVDFQVVVAAYSRLMMQPKPQNVQGNSGTDRTHLHWSSVGFAFWRGARKHAPLDSRVGEMRKCTHDIAKQSRTRCFVTEGCVRLWTRSTSLVGAPRGSRLCRSACSGLSGERVRAANIPCFHLVREGLASIIEAS